MVKLEEALGAKEKIDLAQEKVREARDVLTKANHEYAVASAEFVRILQEAKDQNTPELHERALKEHLEILRTELKTAVEAGDYDTVAELAKKLKAKETTGNLQDKKEVKTDEVERSDLENAVDEFLVDNGITSDKDMKHYHSRAGFLSGQSSDSTTEDIISAMQREFDTAKNTRPVADPGWTGHRKAA
ncbi:MAG: hypothetical protein Q7R65_01440 [bacterium]|nr:hypothetical protein [bacterium]